MHDQSEKRGDSGYAYAESSPPTSANGFLNFNDDGYELCLRPILMMFGDNRERITPQEAAEMIWADFIEQAGIAYC